jgi:hypothetical protein
MVTRGRPDARTRAHAGLPAAANPSLIVCGTISLGFARYCPQLCVEERFFGLLNLRDGIRQVLCVVVNAAVRGQQSGPSRELSSDCHSHHVSAKD